ncbi:hypothetical protein Tco_1152481 [Tanacetum coccineum]
MLPLDLHSCQWILLGVCRTPGPWIFLWSVETLNDIGHHVGIAHLSVFAADWNSFKWSSGSPLPSYVSKVRRVHLRRCLTCASLIWFPVTSLVASLRISAVSPGRGAPVMIASLVCTPLSSLFAWELTLWWRAVQNVRMRFSSFSPKLLEYTTRPSAAWPGEGGLVSSESSEGKWKLVTGFGSFVLVLSSMLLLGSIMAPKKTTNTTSMTNAQLKALIAHAVADALAEIEANQSRNGDDSHDSGSGRPVQADRECTYPNFLKCKPLNFKGTEGVNSHVKTTTPEAAHAMPWKTLKKMMTYKYCPRGKIKKIESEM